MNQFFVTLLTVFAVGTAQAQESSNQSTIKTSDVQKAEKPQEDIDNEITNPKLRAELGSKSQWSIRTSFAYSGGSLEKPTDQIRPNYRAGADAPALTSLSGSIGVKYALSARDSVSLSTGVAVLNPFHGDLTRNDFEDPRLTDGSVMQRLEVSTPALSYQRAYKVGEMQMVTDVGYSHFTDSDSVNQMNGIGSVSFGQTILADLGTSAWSAGVSFLGAKYFWGGDINPDYQAQTGALQTDYVYGLFPFAEYTFSQKVSFRTVFGYFQNIKRVDVGEPGGVTALAPYQSMGIGWAATRDIYLYPNVQFTPLDIRADRTNIGLTAYVNMF